MVDNESLKKEHLFIGYIGFLESLKNQVSSILEKYDQLKSSIGIFDFEGQDQEQRVESAAKALINQFKREFPKINKILGLEKDEVLSFDEIPKNLYATLVSMLPQIEKGIKLLQSNLSQLTSSEAMKLDALNNEVKNILTEIPEKYEKNIKEAINEIEKGYFLGSSLISCRIIMYVLDQIPGKNISEKIEKLKEVGVIDEKGKITHEYIIKADKKARNYFSHNIEAVPGSSEALELLSISIRMMEVIKKLI